jgi:2-amino-4-hydroxy-6-hydroxymethyldihydropteridine diphosphokinase
VEKAFLHLGSNIGDRVNNLNEAIEAIKTDCGDVLRRSSVYETEPWGMPDQDNFLNIVIEIRTAKDPIQLLNTVKNVEVRMGREQKVKWGPRKIDIDILSFGQKKLKTQQLEIPHPRIKERNFVLIPFMELAPDLILPGQQSTIEELYEACRDTCEVYIYEG